MCLGLLVFNFFFFSYPVERAANVGILTRNKGWVKVQFAYFCFRDSMFDWKRDGKKKTWKIISVSQENSSHLRKNLISGYENNREEFEKDANVFIVMTRGFSCSARILFCTINIGCDGWIHTPCLSTNQKMQWVVFFLLFLTILKKKKKTVSFELHYNNNVFCVLILRTQILY